MTNINSRITTGQESRTLSQCYDGDLALRDEAVKRLRATLRIPHPLYNVRYADGVKVDTTAGQVLSHGRKVEW